MWKETARQVLTSTNHISGQTEYEGLTWALGYEPEERKSLAGFVHMGSTSKPAQDGKLLLGNGKLGAAAASGEILAYFGYTRGGLLSLAAQVTGKV